MVHNCAIISCPLHNRRNIRKGIMQQLAYLSSISSLFQGLLFHSFPVDQHRFELWRQTVFNHCSQTLSINKHSKICYRHFHSDDYIANHTGLTRYLKATAIPSIFTEANSNAMNVNMNILNNHLCQSSTNTSSFSTEIASPLNLVLPPKSSSSSILTITTNPKVKRLQNTIDKLHQIQNANKNVLTQQCTIEHEHVENDEDDYTNKVIEQQTLKPTQMIHDNSLSLRTTDTFIIDHKNFIQDQESIRMINKEDTCSRSPIQLDGFRWCQSTSIPSPKTELEDALHKFLEQANLLQYYSAFIEQGGDDLKQLAEAENDDFEEIIRLVGMASKPLHVKRFKKALADYRQSLSSTNTDHSFLHQLSMEETLSDRGVVYSSVIHPTLKIDHCKSNSMHQLLDDNHRKMIADEAERIANLLPITANNKFNGRNNCSKDTFNMMNLPKDFEDRWQRIRKYSAIYNRFDSKTSNQAMNLHEILINEAAAAICFHRPEFLTRRDELFHLARRILQNIGISSKLAQKRPLSVPKCDNITSTKQIRLNMPLSKTPIRQRDPEAFRLMWHNRETKVEQIPIEIESLRCEQNRLLQQLKQSTIDSSSTLSADYIELKGKIDDISRKIEQLSDEEKNLRRLIRKKNMRLRAKERQQQKQQQLAVSYLSNAHSSVLPIIPMTPTQTILPNETSQHRPIFENKNDNLDSLQTITIKDEKIEPIVNLVSPALKATSELSKTDFAARMIDRRRDEINDRVDTVAHKDPISNYQASRSAPKRHSSSITAIGSIQDSDCHAPTSTYANVAIFSNEHDIMESKNFVQNLAFDVST